LAAKGWSQEVESTVAVWLVHTGNTNCRKWFEIRDVPIELLCSITYRVLP